MHISFFGLDPTIFIEGAIYTSCGKEPPPGNPLSGDDEDMVERMRGDEGG